MIIAGFLGLCFEPPSSSSTHLLPRRAPSSGRPTSLPFAARDDQLTYRELDAAEQRDRPSSLLPMRCVARGHRVVLHTPKSVAALAAAYGVMKTGAAYVPIEPGSPASRLAAIVEQCKPRGIVMLLDAPREAHRGTLPERRASDLSSARSTTPRRSRADLPIASLSPSVTLSPATSPSTAGSGSPSTATSRTSSSPRGPSTGRAEGRHALPPQCVDVRGVDGRHLRHRLRQIASRITRLSTSICRFSISMQPRPPGCVSPWCPRAWRCSRPGSPILIELA